MTKMFIFLILFICISSKIVGSDNTRSENVKNIQQRIESIGDINTFNSSDERVEALFALYAKKYMGEYPIFATNLGYEGYDGLWWDFSLQAIEEDKKILYQLNQVCGNINENELSTYNKTYFRLLKQDINTNIAQYEQEMFYFVIGQQHGIHQYIPNIFSQHSVSNAEDVNNLLKLMKTVDKPIDDTIELLKKGVAKKLTAPIVTMKGVPDQLRTIVESEGDQTPFYEPFKNLNNFNDKLKSDFRSRALKIIKNKLIPAYKRLMTFINETYIPQCRPEIGLFNLPRGQEKYLNQIKYYTTTQMTAKEIHELGLSEVKRIKKEMETLKQETGFKGNLTDFNEFLRTDPQFFYTTKENLLKDYRDICKRIDPELIKLFGKLPRLPYGVIPVPEYLEKYYSTARYQGGSTKTGTPGYFLANTYDLKSRPKWEMEALSLHEAVPGHHLQIALEQEIENQPEFKKFVYYTVFVEGWGLYAESLGDKLGMYKDLYSKYGQLTYEMWRAVRLVVDTGIHAFGWSRQKAIDYFIENSAKAIKDIEGEVDRYIAWPGQSLAYKIGELKIKELKSIAKKELGEKFDIRAFHNMLLSTGSLPISVLKHNVEDWIKEQN